MSKSAVFIRCQLFFFFFILFHSCEQLHDVLDESTLALVQNSDPIDFGYINFDSTGNIIVEVNNTFFKNNPLISQASYIGVWVFPKRANVNLNCCTGSSTVCGESANACMVGVGFSHDLGFLGSRYIFKEPPQVFNKFATKYYISMKAANKTGIPLDYQGEYTLFSAPTNPVQDRQQFDLYLGIYYSVLENETLRVRPVNLKAEIGTQTYYSRVAPDILSPKITIESRFFPTSSSDIPGSRYIIPSIDTWTTPPPLDTEIDKRGNIRINEIGNYVGGDSLNDFIELYNPTDFEIPLDDLYIQRFTSTNCKNISSASQKEDLTGLVMKPKTVLALARAGNTLSNITRTFKSNSGITISNDDCYALTKGTASIQSPTDSRVVDFVGFRDSNNTNLYLGSGPTISVYDESAISRCPDGADSRNNLEDFFVEEATPGLANICTFAPQAESILTASVGDILISEILYSGSTTLGVEGSSPEPYCLDTGSDDFVEIVNVSNKTYNMGGARLQYINSSGTVSSFYTFGSFNLAPGSYAVVVSQDKGCYTASTLSQKTAFFRSSASVTSPFNFSGSGATIALTRSSQSLSSPQSPAGAIQSDSISVLDYVGWASNGQIYLGALAPNCNPNATSRSSMRRKSNTQNTSNNSTDFECGIPNGTPGRAE